MSGFNPLGNIKYFHVKQSVVSLAANLNASMKKLIVLFLSLHSLQAFSRTLPGYYLSKNNDTVRCEFKLKDWDVTPRSVEIVHDGRPSTLTAADINGFGVYGVGDYVSREISYHKGNYTSLEAPDVFSDKITTQRSFLQLAVPGKYSLYELKEPYHTYFFVEDANGLNELVYRVKRSNMIIEQDNTFRKQIFAYFTKEVLANEFVSDITNSVYERRSIVPLFRKLNEKISGVKYAPQRKGRFAVDVYVGGVYTQIPKLFDGKFTQDVIKYKDATSLAGGLTLMYHGSGHFVRTAVGLSLGYNKFSSEAMNEDSIMEYRSIYNNETTQYRERYTLKNSSVMMDVFGMYFLNPADRMKVYLRAGVLTNIRSTEFGATYVSSITGTRNGTPYTKSDNQSGSFEENRLYFNAHAGIGLNVGRHKLDFNYYTPSQLDYALPFKARMMSVFYSYTLTK